MFTLVRIENSRTNAPEIEKIPHKDFNSELSAGVAVEKYDTGWDGASSYPYYVVAKTPKETDEYVLVYRVTPDMIFLTLYLGEEPYKVEDYVSIVSQDMYPDAVSVDNLGYGRIVEVVPGSRNVYVKFDRRREYQE